MTGSFGVTRNAFELGQLSSNPKYAGNGFLTPSEAKSIDIKLDDGIASRGILHGIDGDSDVAGICSQAWNHSGTVIPPKLVGLVSRQSSFGSICQLLGWCDAADCHIRAFVIICPEPIGRRILRVLN